jgi:hypothetical protein
MQLSVLNVCRPQPSKFSCVIPEIDIWRAANLMLKRYGDKALEESAKRADELAAQDDYNGAAVWRRITPPSASSRTRRRRGRCTDNR